MVLSHLKAVGPELAAVLPQDGEAWYKKRNLRRLNFSIFCMVILASANGYDGSLMNGNLVLNNAAFSVGGVSITTALPVAGVAAQAHRMRAEPSRIKTAILTSNC